MLPVPKTVRKRKKEGVVGEERKKGKEKEHDITLVLTLDILCYGRGKSVKNNWHVLIEHYQWYSLLIAAVSAPTCSVEEVVCLLPHHENVVLKVF